MSDQFKALHFIIRKDILEKRDHISRILLRSGDISLKNDIIPFRAQYNFHFPRQIRGFCTSGVALELPRLSIAQSKGENHAR